MTSHMFPRGLYQAAYVVRPLTASEKGEQDEQIWRAERIKARLAAEQRAQPQPRVTDLWAAARRAG